MRITNNMMMHNTSNNINGNKINVDTMNNQMSSQKKIQRPSEDPVVAIRALRLRTSLSEIDQYYENNIPDAESWMEVTQTALTNMKSILTDVRSQCVYGSNDSLKTQDRETILSQLQKLREQIYSEGNADYAGRTVFTGYRTNQKLTFMTSDPDTKYEITQDFSYSNIEEHRYYGGQVTVPTNDTEVKGNTIPNPTKATFDRIRLSYGGVESDPAITFKPEQDPPVTITSYGRYSDWADPDTGEYKIPAGEAVFIQETGELILSPELSSKLRSEKADISVTYTKEGFDKGELRPEYYYNCKDVTDPVNPKEYVKFENGEEVYQDINYVVAANQTMTVNTNASDVFDASVGRDVDELIIAVENAISASKKVEDIKAMQGMEAYASQESQDALKDWLEAAQKEADYAEDNMQKLYNGYIGNCDKYLEKVNLALTTVGSKGVSLDLIKNRMSNQQSTIETLKSTNEDRELSDIIIDYTAAQSAYEISLQAASKISKNTLLNYL